MKRLTFPNPFSHSHAPVQNVNALLEEKSDSSQRAADWVATVVGSWRFIIGQTVLLIFWVILNVTA